MLKAGGEGDDRGWDGWMVSPTQWAWVWASSGSWWWTGKPGMLQSMGSQRVGDDWVTELNWTYPLWGGHFCVWWWWWYLNKCVSAIVGMTQFTVAETSETIPSDIKICTGGWNEWTSQRVSFSAIFTQCFLSYLALRLLGLILILCKLGVAEFHVPW